METNSTTTEVGFCELDEYTGASPDGFVDMVGLLEIKCKNDPNYVKVLAGEKIDPGHDWQMQMQMWVTGKDWCDYAVYNPNFVNKPLVITRVYRDNVKINKLVQGVKTGIEIIKGISERIKL